MACNFLDSMPFYYIFTSAALDDNAADTAVPDSAARNGIFDAKPADGQLLQENQSEMTCNQLKREIHAAIDHRAPEILALAEDLWHHPETGFREFRTSRLIREKLTVLGLPVREYALTGFRADLDTGREGPVCGLLGEMDALLNPNHPEADPETDAVHACGHHTHIAAMTAAAMGLCDAGAAAHLCGKIAFIGCPAEESIELDYRTGLQTSGQIAATSGKAALILAGAFDDVDTAVMLHVGEDRRAMDSSGVVLKCVTFRGQSCHAASPQNGVNATDALALARHAIALLRERYSNESMVRIHGIITRSGEAVNIIPGSASMEYMLRADRFELLADLSRRFDRAMRGAALAAGCGLELRSLPGAQPMRNDPELYRMCCDACGELYPGLDFVREIYRNPGSTDMGDVGCILPAVHGGVPGVEGTCHGADFRIADLKTACLESAKVLASVAVDLLYGNGETGRRFARKKQEEHMSVERYRQLRERLTSLIRENAED